MNPNRVDFLIDLAYGVLLFFAIVLIVYVGTGIGIAFGLGALVSYIIHVGWKMARFDPQWMTEEVAENIEETITEEVTESVGEKVTEEVTEEVTESVGEKVTQEVTSSVIVSSMFPATSSVIHWGSNRAIFQPTWMM